MNSLLTAVTLLTNLTQLTVQAASAAAEVGALIEKARAEGRDVTEAELDVVRKSVMDVRARLVG
jgi:hypothetical protein